MATIGLLSLTETLLNQTAGLGQQVSVATASDAATGNNSAAPIVDVFTPSAQDSAIAAGLFSVNSVSPFSPAAEALLAPVVDAEIATANAQAARAIAAPADTAANNQVALQRLNSDLEALGLNTASISKIDGIASLINNFNPAAFTALAFQLEAQQPASPSATPKVAPALTKVATA